MTTPPEIAKAREIAEHLRAAHGDDVLYVLGQYLSNTVLGKWTFDGVNPARVTLFRPFTGTAHPAAGPLCGAIIAHDYGQPAKLVIAVPAADGGFRPVIDLEGKTIREAVELADRELRAYGAWLAPTPDLEAKLATFKIVEAGMIMTAEVEPGQ
tara:strand:- start:162 stop:623 length:462 start_codon:yes stop_codon:yes gene_type:complete